LIEGKQIPTELRNESETLKNDLLFDEHQEGKKKKKKKKKKN